MLPPSRFRWGWAGPAAGADPSRPGNPGGCRLSVCSHLIPPRPPRPPCPLLHPAAPHSPPCKSTPHLIFPSLSHVSGIVADGHPEGSQHHLLLCLLLGIPGEAREQRQLQAAGKASQASGHQVWRRRASSQPEGCEAAAGRRRGTITISGQADEQQCRRTLLDEGAGRAARSCEGSMACAGGAAGRPSGLAPSASRVAEPGAGAGGGSGSLSEPEP